MTYVGIDNGCSGAVGILHPDRSFNIFPMQTWAQEKRGKTKAGKTKADTFVDEVWLDELLAKIEGPFHVICEAAQKFSPGKLALISTWSCFAAIRAVLKIRRYKFTAVNPSMWQRDMLKGCIAGETGPASIAAAKAIFPNVSLLRSARCTTDCDGMSDALLIAEWGRRNNL